MKKREAIAVYDKAKRVRHPSPALAEARKALAASILKENEVDMLRCAARVLDCLWGKK